MLELIVKGKRTADVGEVVLARRHARVLAAARQNHQDHEDRQAERGRAATMTSVGGDPGSSIAAEREPSRGCSRLRDQVPIGAA